MFISTRQSLKRKRTRSKTVEDPAIDLLIAREFELLEVQAGKDAFRTFGLAGSVIDARMEATVVTGAAS